MNEDVPIRNRGELRFKRVSVGDGYQAHQLAFHINVPALTCGRNATRGTTETARLREQ